MRAPLGMEKITWLTLVQDRQDFRAHEHIDFGEFHGESRSQFARCGCLCRPYEDRFVPRSWSLVGYTLIEGCRHPFVRAIDVMIVGPLSLSVILVLACSMEKVTRMALHLSVVLVHARCLPNADPSAPCRRASKVPRRRVWINIFISSTCRDRHLYFFIGQPQHQHFGPLEGDEKHCFRWKHRTL